MQGLSSCVAVAENSSRCASSLNDWRKRERHKLVSAGLLLNQIYVDTLAIIVADECGELSSIEIPDVDEILLNGGYDTTSLTTIFSMLNNVTSIAGTGTLDVSSVLDQG